MHAPGADGGESDEDESQRQMMQQDFSHAEERAVNHDYAENPAPEIAREVMGLRNFGGLGGDGLPAGHVRHDFAIERNEDAVRFAGGEKSYGDPDQGGEQRCGENVFGENHGVGAGEKSWTVNKGVGQTFPVQRERGGKSGDHCGNFTPSVNAPPIPAKHVDAAGAGANLQDDLPAGTDRSELRGNIASGDDQENGYQLGDVNVMTFGGATNEEAAVKIFDDVRSAPVELGGDGRHEGREKTGHDNSAQRVRDVIVDDHHVTRFRMRQARVENDRGERGKNPGPRAKRVVGDVEPKHGKQSLAFIAGAEDSLGHVTTAAWFRTGIPKRPPLHAEIDGEGDDRQSPKRLAGETAGEAREKSQGIGAAVGGAHGVDLRNHMAHAAGRFHRVVGDGNDDAHLQDELKKIGPEHAREAAERNVNSGEWNQKENADDQGVTVGSGKRRAENPSQER